MVGNIDIQGHRGARGRRPENTWPAFKYALNVGAPTLELDVVISKDKEVVVSHEPWICRKICKQPGGAAIPKHAKHVLNMFNMTYQEIAAFDCGSLRHPDFPEQESECASKPLLGWIISESEKYARRIGREVPNYSIEIKSKRDWEGTFHPDPATFTALVANLLGELEVESRVILQSFDPRVLRCVHTHYPSFKLAYLLPRPGSLGMKRKLRQLGLVPDIYSPSHELVNKRMVRKAHIFEMKIIPWTVNSTTRMIHLLHLGVDGLVTDYPEAGLDAVRIFQEKLSREEA